MSSIVRRLDTTGSTTMAGALELQELLVLSHTGARLRRQIRLTVRNRRLNIRALLGRSAAVPGSQDRDAGTRPRHRRRLCGWCERRALRPAGVGVGAVLLGRPGAIAVGQAVAHPVQVLLFPLGTCCWAVGVVADALAADVDPLGLVAVESLPDGAVMDFGIMPCHIWAGVAEQFLHHVLGDARIYEPGPQGVAELVPGHPHLLVCLVAQVERLLPAAQLGAKDGVHKGLGPIGVAGEPREQPRGAGGPVLAHVRLLGRDDRRRLGRQRDELLGTDLGGLETQAWPAG